MTIEKLNEIVPLKRRGARYWGCCPFHDEEIPSFTVTRDLKKYHCFGCGKDGTVKELVQEVTNDKD